MTDSPDDRSPLSEALSLGELAGFRLYLHWSLLLLPILVMLGFLDPVAMAIILPSIAVHELAHAVTCRCLGLGSGSIMMWLFGGFFFPKNLGMLPFQMNYSQRLRFAAVIGAGPLSNLVLFGFFRLAQLGASSPALFQRIAEINLDIVMFNLMPMSHFDGARLALTIGMSEPSRQRLQKVLAAFLLLSGSVGVYVGFTWKVRELAWTLWLIGWSIGMYSLSQKTNEKIEAEYPKPSKPA
jgi:Zn-dependent protease